MVVALTLLLGYPAAWFLVRSGSRYRHILLLALIAPLLVSIVIRTVGWLILLGDQGPVLYLWRSVFGPADVPTLLFNPYAIIVGMTHILVPFMVISIASSLAAVDRSLEHVAASLGAGPVQVFRRITFPSTLPGVVSGCILVFSLTVGAYLTPLFLGGGKIATVASTIYEEAMVLIDIPRSAALSVLLLVVVFAPLVAVSAVSRRRRRVRGARVDS